MRKKTEGGVSKSNCHPQEQQSLLINVLSWDPKFRYGMPFEGGIAWGSHSYCLWSINKSLIIGLKFFHLTSKLWMSAGFNVIGRLWWLKTLTLESDQTDLSSNLICIIVSVSSCCINKHPQIWESKKHLFSSQGCRLAGKFCFSGLNLADSLLGLLMNLPSEAWLGYSCSWMASGGITELSWCYLSSSGKPVWTYACGSWQNSRERSDAGKASWGLGLEQAQPHFYCFSLIKVLKAAQIRGLGKPPHLLMGEASKSRAKGVLPGRLFIRVINIFSPRQCYSKSSKNGHTSMCKHFSRG